jgi:sarcosine oxidase / L-pipecolate oxidase
MVLVDGEEQSVPFARQQIPVEAEARMRTFLAETMPQFRSRPFNFARICWDTDTVDRRFLIDRHPDLKNLIVSAGGSGNGFMTNPAVGKVVVDVLENKLEERLGRVLRWRPDIATNRDWLDTQDRFGAEGKVMDFKNVSSWTRIGEDAKL